jgi:hypothetical protein
MRGDCASGSLSVRSRAIVGRQSRNGRGGAVTPPDPAPGKRRNGEATSPEPSRCPHLPSRREVRRPR